jgi:NifB/MoaA-like Fe-S oxidoreductase
MKRRLGTTFCYVADELVLAAGKPIPAAAYYEGFPQRENGVGLVRGTIEFLVSAVPQGRALRARGVKRAWALTGESFAPVLGAMMPALRERLPEIRFEMVVVENRLFGRPTTVAGLLGGRDLLEAGRGRVSPGDLVLVPDESVNEDGAFLDDLTLEDLARELRGEVVAGWHPLFAAAEAEEEDDPPGLADALGEGAR